MYDANTYIDLELQNNISFLYIYFLLFQDELDQITSLWNTHMIRPRRNQRSPSGLHVMMYTAPHLYGAQDHICQSENEDLRICKEESREKGEYPCDDTVYDICCLLMAENDWSATHDVTAAIELYNLLRDCILDNL